MDEQLIGVVTSDDEEFEIPISIIQYCDIFSDKIIERKIDNLGYYELKEVDCQQFQYVLSFLELYPGNVNI